MSVDADDKRSVTSEVPPSAPASSPPSGGIARSKSMFGVFSRKKTAAHTEDARTKSPTLPTRTDTSNSAASVSTTTPVKGNTHAQTHSSHKRDPKTNSEATLLRSQIAATEYELQRLAKTMRKKIIISAPPLSGGREREGKGEREKVRFDKHHITSAEYSGLQDQQSDLQRKLQLLRQRHVELTGETYEQSKAKASRVLSGRFRLSRKQSDLDETGSSYTASSPAKSKQTNGDSAKKNVHSRPAHWVNFTK